MIVQQLYLSPTTKIANDYLLKDSAICHFFEYHYTDQQVYEKRLTELKSRFIDREKLVQSLKPFMEKLLYNERAMENVEKLLDPNTVAIVGGQQPGVLTGPLYTIYKIITIIKLAKEQENKLGVNVVPIFWIAGEDHDFDEINHLFIQQGKTVEKKALNNLYKNKLQLSDIKLDQKQLEKWLIDVFRTYKETAYTADLHAEIKNILHHSTTYVDFFANILNWLFKDEGVILLNSADPHIRKLEGPLFSEIIEKNEPIYHAFLDQSNHLAQLGYPKPIDLPENHANLFFVNEGKREKIIRTNENFIIGSETYNREQLQKIALTNPTCFSNNVVTRPVMQEFLLPVLAFVAGPGEIAYWSTLKGVFSQVSMKMPPVVPRLSISLLTNKEASWLDEFQLTVNDLFENRLKDKKEQWYHSVKEWDVQKHVDEAKGSIFQAHTKLQKLACEISPSLKKIAEKNYQIIESQIMFLQRKLEREVQSQYEHELSKFVMLENAIQPDGKPQERAFNIFYYLNLYGFDFINKLLEIDLKINEMHKIIFL